MAGSASSSSRIFWEYFENSATRSSPVVPSGATIQAVSCSRGGSGAFLLTDDGFSSGGRLTSFHNRRFLRSSSAGWPPASRIS